MVVAWSFQVRGAREAVAGLGPNPLSVAAAGAAGILASLLLLLLPPPLLVSCTDLLATGSRVANGGHTSGKVGQQP
jgi:hypothetical protein